MRRPSHDTFQSHTSHINNDSLHAQDVYHVPPSWWRSDGGEDEILIRSKTKLPNNVTTINPALASVVYRTDASSKSKSTIRAVLS